MTTCTKDLSSSLFRSSNVAAFDLVVACDENRGIGARNALPWRLPGDMKHFRALTTEAADTKQNAVIMGRKTWESIPSKFRPLPNRLNLVITRQNEYVLPENVLKCCSLNDALSLARISNCDRVFVAGGGEIYRQAVAHPECEQLFITEVMNRFDCDVFFPPYEEEFELISESAVMEENGIRYRYKTFRRRTDRS